VQLKGDEEGGGLSVFYACPLRVKFEVTEPIAAGESGPASANPRWCLALKGRSSGGTEINLTTATVAHGGLCAQMATVPYHCFKIMHEKETIVLASDESRLELPTIDLYEIMAPCVGGSEFGASRMTLEHNACCSTVTARPPGDRCWQWMSWALQAFIPPTAV
jgi:hypothetical protein